jgi:Icc-related predicted phosphoesterase
MKILYTTDLHGTSWKYNRLPDIARQHAAEVAINGGDMLPKTGDLFSQGKFITGSLEHHFSAFNKAGIAYLCYLGNDDLAVFDPLFEETCRKYPLVSNLAQTHITMGAYEFIGMNWVVDTPFRLKDRCRMDTPDYVFQEQFGTGLLSTPNGRKEIADWQDYARSLPTIQDEMERLDLPDDPDHTVYVVHMPPSDLGLDQCGNGDRVGSKAIYNFLQKLQPRLALHGHIHESPETSGIWRANLGNTVCVQPGQLSPFTYVVIDLGTMQMERYTDDFYSG